ncbi:MAG: MFS transporter [Candidatus Acidiferrales bacterium]|jgi:EmrB/QacA subfamily drug resistance transporter
MQSASEIAARPSVSSSVRAGARSKPWILAATILASSMAFIDSTVVNVALPALQTSFGATVTELQWVVEAYLLLLGSLILVGGSLGDMFGRRRMFLFGVCVFAAASAWCGAAANIHQLIAARAAQGFGAAFLVPGSLSIIGASFEDNERGRAIGTWSGFTAITTVIGPVLGGWLIQHASWRWAFLLNLPIAVAVIVLSLWQVPESRAESVRGPVDWRGALLATFGLGGVVYGLVESSQLTWSDVHVVGAVILGTVCIVLFHFVEKAAKAPMVPPQLFKSHDFTGANILTFLLYGALGVFLFFLPMNLIEVQGYSATAAGAAFLPTILLVFLLSRWSGGLADRYGVRPPLIIGPLIVTVAFLLLAWPFAGRSYWINFFPAIVVLGLGLAVSVAPLTTAIMGAADQANVGAASGINNAVSRISGLIAIAVLGIVVTSVFNNGLNRRLGHIHAEESVKSDILNQRTKLAAIQIPDSLSGDERQAISAAITNSFLEAFRVTMLLCALLAANAAISAYLMIGSGKTGAKRQPAARS